MTNPPRSLLRRRLQHGLSELRRIWETLQRRGPGQVQFWFIALAIGVASGLAALTFRLGIINLQGWVYGTDNIRHLHSFAETLPWYTILLTPIVGGLIVGLILNRFTPDGRVRSVGDVIEGAALYDGRMEKRAGVASMFASLITLSSGGSTGREGPVVHIAGMISSWVCRRIDADGITGRDLLGCAVAAAVSASFNAPIAGALFALEVVLRHFAVHAFAPIVIASVAGTVITRIGLGNNVEFALAESVSLQFYVELPAFLLLGVVSGIVAVILIRSIFLAEDVASATQRRIGLPRWLRPGISGALLGAIAIFYPHIIGVGYETTVRALSGDFHLSEVVIFTVIKVIAVAITFGGHMGGGVFSPSLMIGALTGLAFGLVATGVLPDVSGNSTLYAFAGMGAVAAAVLGAPISTTLIVFELTGDWEIGLAVMLAVSMSTAISTRLVHRSFFLTQLERRGVHLAAGPQAYLLAMLRAGGVMRPAGGARSADPDRCREMAQEGLWILASDSLESAMPLFDRAEVAFLPVLEKDGTDPIGALFHIDALKAYNRMLAATAAEEHS
ncbi:chloride channel protein [Chachezhania sediminis]|uniref:chloride channel protein n=1 Tax=Chachezhania sediminis TaxID=2599291 RepID=UPI00131E1B2B|nr:chloride channel protein [Chachezhania sediminis]